MASANSSNWSQMKDLVNNTFDNIVRMVNKRREDVLSKLYDLRGENDDLSNSIKQVRSTISLVHEKLKGNNVIDVQEKTTVDLKTKLTELESERNIDHVFVCNQKELNRTLDSLGSFEEFPLYYLNKIEPKFVFPSKSVSNLRRPVKLSVDESLDLIAITDRTNKQVCLFSLNGQFINSFGKEYFLYPYAVKIINHNEIILSDSVKQCIALIHYERNKKGRFRVKSRLTEMHSITALDFDKESNLIYATDSVTHSLLILNKGLKIVRELRKFLFPQNIFISSEKIYIQDINNPSLHILSKSSLLILESIIPRGISLNTEFPLSLTVDSQGYIIIGDKSCAIQVYSQSGQLLHSFSKQRAGLGEVDSPYGIHVLANYDVIVISNNPRSPIQVF